MMNAMTIWTNSVESKSNEMCIFGDHEVALQIQYHTQIWIEERLKKKTWKLIILIYNNFIPAVYKIL